MCGYCVAATLGMKCSLVTLLPYKVKRIKFVDIVLLPPLGWCVEKDGGGGDRK